jgi:type II secretory pathway component GspD/PulD (secretin)
MKFFSLLGLAIFFSLSAFADALLEPVNCTFTNTDFKEAIAAIANDANASITVDGDRSIKINLKLGKVPFSQALTELCQLGQYYPIQLTDHSFVVTSGDPSSSYYANICKVEAVKLNYLKASELIALLSKHPLQKFVSTGGSEYRISITGTANVITELKKLIVSLDTARGQIRTDFVVFDKVTDDTASRNATLEVTRGKANPDGAITWQYNGEDSSLNYLNARNGKTIMSLFGSNSTDQMNILANPTITTLDGEECLINFAKVTYFPGVATNGNLNFVKPEGIETGIKLQIISRIISVADNAGQPTSGVMLIINAEIAEISATGPQGLPIVNKRTVRTTVVVRSGETIVCGGEHSKISFKNTTRPGLRFLEQIPLLGNLFRSKRGEERDQETIMLITPTIVEAGDGQSVIDDAKSKMDQIWPESQK